VTQVDFEISFNYFSTFIAMFEVLYLVSMQNIPQQYNVHRWSDTNAILTATLLVKKAFLRTRYTDIRNNILYVFQNFKFLISRILSFSYPLLDKKIISCSGILNVHFHDLGDSRRDGVNRPPPSSHWPCH